MKIVAFDDEKLLLNSLKRLIFRLDEEIDFISFDCEGEIDIHNACKLLPDIAICDYSLKNSEHHTIMNEFKTSSPETIRVTLTGRKTLDVISESFNESHFIIGKPFQDSDFINLIEVYYKVKELHLGAKFYECLSRLELSYCFPQTLKEISDCLKSPRSSVSDVANAVSHDLVLTSKVIQLSNSAYLGFSRPTVSLSEAVTRLGLQQIESISLFILAGKLSSSQENISEVERLFDVSFQAANFAKKLAKDYGLPTSAQENLFSYTIMSFLGDVLLAASGLNKNQEQNNFGDFDIIDMDRSLSAYILTLWGFDDYTVSVILGCNNICSYHSTDDLFTHLSIVYLSRGNYIGFKKPIEEQKICDNLLDSFKKIQQL